MNIGKKKKTRLCRKDQFDDGDGDNDDEDERWGGK